MKKNRLVAPVVKWVGGKRQLLEYLIPMLPQKITTYCEPFVGGGALLFDQQPKICFINDINKELMDLYEVIRDDVELLIATLAKFKNDAEYFYAIRSWDRDKEKFFSLSKIQRAARMIYLNKTCYNGLFRVNNAGEFNAPFGYYKNPNIINAPVLHAVHSYFQTAKVTMTCADYADVLHDIPKNTFVYLDPPYDPISDTSNFTGYSKNGFDKDEQIRLRECCDELEHRGIKFMLSNSATNFIQEQYNNYNITIVQAKRAINSNSSRRGDVDEVIVRNYE